MWTSACSQAAEGLGLLKCCWHEVARTGSVRRVAGLAECQRVHLLPPCESSRMRTDTSFVLLYDGDCRVCSAFARTVTWLSGRRSIQRRTIQTAHGLLAGMPEEAALASAHMVSPDGRIRTGPDVLPAIVGALLGRPRLEDQVNASPWARSAADRTYRLLVALRGSLSCASGASSSAGRTPR